MFSIYLCMENVFKQAEILKYLDKNYVVVENAYISKSDGQHEWGNHIMWSLGQIFCHGKELTTSTFKYWAFNNGIKEDDWESTLNPRVLRAEWTPEMADDLRQYGVMDAEEQLMNILSQELAREIDAHILMDLRGQISSSEDYLTIVKCVGYEPGQPIYDPMTFTPKRKFRAITYNEVENERKNNPYWQDWVRTRRQD